MSSSPNALLDLLLESQALDRVPRMGFAMRGVSQPESVSEHGWHLTFLIWALAPEVPEIDPARALEMALVHDLAEVRIGDLPLTSGKYLPEGAKQLAEERAFADLTGSLGERALELFADFQVGNSLEARFVKACDKLQLMIKVAVYQKWGATGLEEFWQNPDNFPALGIKAVDQLTAELRRRFDSD